MNKSKKIWGIVAAALSAVTFALSPTCCKFTYQYGWGDIATTTVSLFMALIMLGILCLIRKVPMRLSRRELGAVLVGGIGCFAGVLFFNMAAARITAGATTSIHYLHPTLILIASICFFKFKVTAMRVLSAICSIVGVFCFFQSGGSMLTGSLLALASAFTYGFYSMVVEHTCLSVMPTLKLSFYITMVSMTCCAITGLLSGTLTFSREPKGLLWVFLLAFTSDVLGILLYQTALQRIGATQTTLTATLEPLASIAFGAIFFREAVTLRVVIGGLMIVAGIVMNTLSTLKEPEKAS